MNKAVCRLCINRYASSSPEPRTFDGPWVDADEQNWDNAIVHCPPIGNHIGGNVFHPNPVHEKTPVLEEHQPPVWCMFPVEHIVVPSGVNPLDCS